MEEGVFFETINFAVLKKLPCIFICENNFYSVYTSLKDRQPKNRKIYKMVKSLGINSLLIRNQNLIKNFLKLKKIIQKYRNLQQPLFIEFETFRYLEHCGPNNDDNLNYRSLNQIKFWKKRDPLIK